MRERLTPDEHLERMSDDEWSQVLGVLGRYAERLARGRTWNTRSGLPEDPCTEDLVLSSVAALLEHPARWIPAKKPLLNYLMDDVRGDLLNAWTAVRHRRRVIGSDGETGELLDRIPNRARSPEETSDDGKLIRLLDEIRDFAVSRDYGDEFDLLFVRRMKPAQVAEALDRSRERTYSRIRQMKDLIREHFGEEYAKYLSLDGLEAPSETSE